VTAHTTPAGPSQPLAVPPGASLTRAEWLAQRDAVLCGFNRLGPLSEIDDRWKVHAADVATDLLLGHCPEPSFPNWHDLNADVSVCEYDERSLSLQLGRSETVFTAAHARTVAKALTDAAECLEGRA
jgi:hypothetical protein